MSRLDGIAAELGITRDRARKYTRAIRGHFQAAPSYAVILDVVRHHPSRRPSVEQVVVAIKKRQARLDRNSSGRSRAARSIKWEGRKRRDGSLRQDGGRRSDGRRENRSHRRKRPG